VDAGFSAGLEDGGVSARGDLPTIDGQRDE